MSLKWWHRVILYGVFGWTVEVFFTGMFSAIGGDISATSQTYLWMFPVWGFGGLVFERIAFRFKAAEVHFLSRIFVYTLGIMSVEYCSGGLIYLFAGTIPWDYSSETTWHINGLVRLDYLPCWAICGIVMEKFVFLLKRTKLV